MKEDNDSKLASTPNQVKENMETKIEEENTFSEVIHVKLKCQGCGSTLDPRRTVKDNWGMCTVCGSFMCRTCQIDYSTYSENVCPGSRVTEHHQMEIEEIPLSMIMNFVIHSSPQLETNPVFKAFYQDFSKIADPFGEIISKLNPPVKIHNRYEENWLKLKNIIIQKTRNEVIKF